MSLLTIINNPSSGFFYFILFLLFLCIALLSNSDPLYLAGITTLVVYMICVALGFAGIQLALIASLVYIFIYAIYKIFDLGGIQPYYIVTLLILFLLMVKVGKSKEESVQ